MSAQILIVEDERLVARELEMRVGKLGHQVSGTAATAADAVRLARARTPDLALMDIRLRGQRDGIDAAMTLQEQLGVSVIFLTAHGDPDTVQRARRVAPLGYLLKPLKEGELEVALDVALDRVRAMKLARDRERWLAAMLDALSDAVFATDVVGRVTFLNPAAERLLGVSAARAAGRELAALIPPGQRGLVKRPIVDRLGQRLGTVVVIREPADPAELVAPAPAGAGVGILVIDDDDMIRRTLARMLRGHRVTACDASAGLARLADGERFDLIVCDVTLDGLDGMDVYERVSALAPDQADRMLFVAGGGVSEPTAYFLAAMGQRVIAKPFTPASVRAAVDRHLAVLAGRPRA